MTGLDDVENMQEIKEEEETNEASDFVPLVINITFSLREPATAMYFVMPDASAAPKVTNW